MTWNEHFKRGCKNWLGNFYLKNRLGKTAMLFIIGIMLIGIYSFFHHVPLEIHAKPEATPQKTYDYYIIVDKENDVLLMYVPITARVGDELISEDNKRYVVVEVIDDVAYARFIENILPK